MYVVKPSSLENETINNDPWPAYHRVYEHELIKQKMSLSELVHKIEEDVWQWGIVTLSTYCNWYAVGPIDPEVGLFVNIATYYKLTNYVGDRIDQGALIVSELRKRGLFVELWRDKTEYYAIIPGIECTIDLP